MAACLIPPERLYSHSTTQRRIVKFEKTRQSRKNRTATPSPHLVFHHFVYFERIDGPEGFFECCCVLGDILFARRRQRRAARVGPHLTSPIAAEGRVEDDVEVLEMLLDFEVAGKGSP
jgi:hypothetical protein